MRCQATLVRTLRKPWRTVTITATKAINMLLEEERKGEKPRNTKTTVFVAAAGKPPCKTCGKIHGTVCWTERPDLAPEWFQDNKKGTKRKRDDDQQASALVSIARCF